MRILMVDAYPEVAQMLSKKLNESGCSMEMADSCGEAIRKLAVNRYEWLILDYTLPDGNGLDIIRIIQVPDSGKILFSQEAKKREVMRVAAELGVNGFFKKPEEALKLVEFIRKRRKTRGKIPALRMAGNISK